MSYLNDDKCITIIFGAGASFGSYSSKLLVPPLGDYLFDRLSDLGGHFSALSESQKLIFKDSGFEIGMKSITNSSYIINPLQKEIACYLSGFRVTPDNAYVHLFKQIKHHVKKICITTLNYDLLIEQSLYFNEIQFDYSFKENHVPLFKPHGSSNFLPIADPGLRDIQIHGAYSFFDGMKMNAAGSFDEINKWCNDSANDLLSPVLCMYEPSKRAVINSSFIRAVQQAYKDQVERSSLIVVVGVKYVEHDKHIWEPIKNSEAKLVIVDPKPDESVAWAEKQKFRNVTVIRKGFLDGVNAISKVIKKHKK